MNIVRKCINKRSYLSEDEKFYFNIEKFLLRKEYSSVRKNI